MVEGGEALFWRDGWIPDYAAPDNFLHLLHGAEVPENINHPSPSNATRYNATAFNTNYEAALAEATENECFIKLQKVDQIAMDDAAVLPLWYLNSYIICSKTVGGIAINSLNTYYFREAFLSK